MVDNFQSKGEDVALPNQMHAPTGQVTYCTVGLRHDVTFGQ